jgi:hypothetical protein
MSQFEQDGVIYEDLGNGQVKVVGYADAPAQPPQSMTIGTPRPEKPEKPQNIQRPDGSIWQIFPDGTSRMVAPAQPKGSGADVGKGGTTAKIRDDALQAYNDAIALRRAVADLRTRNKAGPGATTGFAGIQDFLPNEQNGAFDTAAQRARGYVKRSLGFTGGEGNTVSESSTLYDPYLPSTSDWDGKIVDKIAALEQLAADAERKAIATLGGVPDQYGNITQPTAQPAQQQRDDQPMAVAGNMQPPSGPDTTNPMIGSGNGAPLPGGFAPYGAKTRIEKDPARAGLNSEVLGMIKGGVSPDLINQHIASRGGVPASPQVISQAIQYAAQNPKWAGVDLETREVPMSGLQQFANNAPQTMVGTAAATAANAGGLGIPQMLAGGEGLDYLRSLNSGSAFAGDVAGVIGGTAAIGKLGSNVAGRLAPSLLTRGGAKGQFGRQLLADASYGGIYGATTEGDPLTGAGTAALGSAGGTFVGKGLQKGFQGVTDPAVQYLTQRGIPLSLGETFGTNSMVGRQMQRMESIPVLGDMMSARRGEARDAVFNAALEDAVTPAGGTITGSGQDALASAQGIKSQAYSDAYSGINAPIDSQYLQDVAPFIRTGRGIFGDTGPEFSSVVKDELRPLFGPNRALDGTSAQQFGQTVNDFASDFGGRGAYGQKAATNLRGIGDATNDLVDRANPGKAMQMQAANAVNARLTPIENAMITANGKTPTPLQLQRAITSNTKNYGGRATAARGDNVPDVVRYAAENAPNIGNSGTADRLAGIMPLILPTTLGGSAVGLESFSDNPGTSGLLATLALMSTKTGQKAMQAALTKRPDSVRRLGGIFGGRKAQRAIGGAITAPMLIE